MVFRDFEIWQQEQVDAYEVASADYICHPISLEYRNFTTYLYTLGPVTEIPTARDFLDNLHFYKTWHKVMNEKVYKVGGSWAGP